METNSLYFTVGAELIDEIIKSEMHSAYYRECYLWLPSEHCDDCIGDYVATKVAKLPWSLNPCCADQLKFDKRTSGLFKLEFQVNKILPLCSKLYICVGTKECELAHKGSTQNQIACILNITKSACRFNTNCDNK